LRWLHHTSWLKSQVTGVERCGSICSSTHVEVRTCLVRRWH
jgi:hypothetical protein